MTEELVNNQLLQLSSIVRVVVFFKFIPNRRRSCDASESIVGGEKTELLTAMHWITIINKIAIVFEGKIDDIVLKE